MAPRAKSEVETESQAEAAPPEGSQEMVGQNSANRHYREASCGTVRLFDAEGHRLSTIRYGRMPESKKATLCAQLEAACQSIMALRPDLKVVKLADGAQETWRFLDHLDLGLREVQTAEVDSVSITDFYHAAEHLKQACDLIWAAGSREHSVILTPHREPLYKREKLVNHPI
jgi:hypothetical protein